MVLGAMGLDGGNSPSGIGDVFKWVKVGPGVVGRTVPIILVLLAAIIAAILRVGSDQLIMLLVGAAVLAAAGYIAIAFWYANKHPDFSTLDGSTLVDYRRTQMAPSEPKMIDVTNAHITSNTSPQIEREG